jgi:hypothetical protein
MINQHRTSGHIKINRPFQINRCQYYDLILVYFLFLKLNI